MHIGGDEAPKMRWTKCEKCQERMRKENLENEEQLQSYFVNRVVDYLAQKGRKAVSWNESLRGGNLDGSVTVQYWMDKTDNSVKWANSGNGLIVSDFYKYYMDYPYGMTPLSKVYNFSPMIKGLDVAGAQSVRGIETPIWTEYVNNFGRMSYMCYPRFIAVAESAWTTAENKNYKDFLSRLDSVLPMVEQLGIKPAKKDWDPNPFRRLGETVGFFKKNLTKEVISGFLHPDKENE